ncbi:hypothetical protein W02_13720 [Nitrospira sp. KM1]|uniref:SGNH/GDSL hydrolase family protein n=1 Tax=Nitrospira sp. KM1 TaxID=1936990 RepID=UPI0013A75AAE|nr:SGNH/GDSL hydrolase family protein [Nitrospira sp. KM1]BCA54232.1 hypothetical protein W02_13720 [Nitrospira sp. KM1]
MDMEGLSDPVLARTSVAMGWHQKVRVSLIIVLILVNVMAGLSWVKPWVRNYTLSNALMGHSDGFMYAYNLPSLSVWTASDRADRPDMSILTFSENDVLLGPAHSFHDNIRQHGEGLYSHWGSQLLFSSSDNSNPVLNGRVYRVHYPVSVPWYGLGATLLLLALSIFGPGTFVHRAGAPVLFMAIGLAIVIIPFELFLRTEFAKLHVVGTLGQFPPRITPTVNSKGYRDVDHHVENTDGRIRVLILGDSMTFGWGIADDETYPRLISDMAGSRVEVISLAKNGWSTADQLAALRREGLAFHPDLVVVGVVTNDPGPPMTEPSGQQADWVVFKRLPFELMFWRFLDYYINRIGDMYGLKYTYVQWEEDIYDPAKRYRGPWVRAVQRLGDTLASRGIPGYAFVLISPVAPEASSQIRKYDILSDVFANAGFKTTNLHQSYLAEFRNVPEKKLWALPDDAHPGPAINRFFAREVWKTIGPHIESIRAGLPREPSAERRP